MHNCTLSAASGPLHYDKGRRPPGRGGYREGERERERGSILLMTIMKGRARLECALASRPIPRIEMMENGKKNGFATMYCTAGNLEGRKVV